MKISFIQPSRNNLKYLKWSYNSIRKNQGNHEVEICVADDASTDGTWEWCQEMMNKDSHFKAILNDTGKRLGHTILYDRLINEVATKDIAMIYHADMYLCPEALNAIEKYIQKGVIVSLTRIEPPLHPDGPEKILQDFGVEPEEFNEDGLFAFLQSTDSEREIKTTEGIFAPWAFYRSDFQEIGGHDPLYAPQSKEDSDIFNRFQLNGVKFIQTWEGCVYHMTCRGSRRNTVDKAKNIYEDSPEWLAQNMRSTRNFIRKWGSMVAHDKFMKPVIPPKYDIGIEIKNSNTNIVEALEIWCSYIKVDNDMSSYLHKEQKNTIIDLEERVGEKELQNDIIVSLDALKITKQDYVYIQQLPLIVQDSGEVGEFELGNLHITINKIEDRVKELVHINPKAGIEVG